MSELNRQFSEEEMANVILEGDPAFKLNVMIAEPESYFTAAWAVRGEQARQIVDEKMHAAIENRRTERSKTLGGKILNFFS